MIKMKRDNEKALKNGSDDVRKVCKVVRKALKVASLAFLKPLRE